MHIVQSGCVCDNIANCDRRCGVFIYYNDFGANTTDISWMFEASAERMMSNLTGNAPTTYSSEINYNRIFIGTDWGT